MTARTKMAVFTLIAIVAPPTLLFLTFEIALRWLEPPLPKGQGVLLRGSADADKQYELIPGSNGIVAGASVEINSLGCRDREYTLEKPSGTIRVVGIGDSLTFGQGVEEQATFLARLERRLTEGNPAIEVINCGVYGYNVNEEARRFAEIAERFNPDIVIIGYELGDLLQNPRFRKGSTEAGQDPKGVRAPVEIRSLFDLFRKSRAITFVAYRFSFLLKKMSVRNWDSLYADHSPLWENLSAKYGMMAEVARARRIDIAVAIIPELSNLDQRYPFTWVHQRVASMCGSHGMQVVDLLPRFLGQDGPGLWVHPQDRHPNARGHELIADALLGPLDAMVRARVPGPGVP